MSPASRGPSPFISFETQPRQPLFIVLLAARGTLEMHLYDRAVPTAIDLLPGKAAEVAVDDMIRDCIDKKGLCWSFHGHATLPQARFVPAAEYRRAADGNVLGPIFSIQPLRS